MKEQIKNIIDSYCEGINHLEFNIADLDKMADEILALQRQCHVSGQSEQFVCRDCEKKTKEYKDNLCEPCHKWHTN